MPDVQEHEIERQSAALPTRAGEPVAVQKSELRELAPGAGDGSMSLAALMDVPVQVTVEVGRTALSLGELCRLGPGSLLRLDRDAHQPVDILVNGKVVAHGEIVTIQESYGVRIADVVS